MLICKLKQGSQRELCAYVCMRANIVHMKERKKEVKKMKRSKSEGRDNEGKHGSGGKKANDGC